MNRKNDSDSEHENTGASKWFWIISVLLLGIGLPFGLSVIAGDETREQRTNDIIQMSSTQRSGLTRNESKFRSASQKTQSEYKELHQTLTGTDPRSKEMQAVSEDYLKWLSQLGFSDWDRISNETDPAARASIVSQIAKDRLEARQKIEEIITADVDFQSNPRDPFQPPSISSEKLEAIFDILEQELSVNERVSLQGSGTTRQLQTLKKLLTASRSSSRFRIDNEAYEQIMQQFASNRMTEAIQKFPLEFRKIMMARVLITALMTNIGKESLPSDDELREYIWSLSEGRRASIMNFPDPRAAKRYLIYGYFAARGGGPANEWRELKSILDRMRGGGRDRRPGTGPRPTGGGNRPDADRRERERPRDPQNPNDNKPPFPPRGPKPNGLQE